MQGKAGASPLLDKSCVIYSRLQCGAFILQPLSEISVPLFSYTNTQHRLLRSFCLTAVYLETYTVLAVT